MADKYCVHCGKRIDENSSYCTHCGKTVARRRTQQKKKKSGLSIPKMILMFIIIFVLCVGIVFYLMTRDTGIVTRNEASPSPSAMAETSPTQKSTQEPLETVQPSPTATATPESTKEPTVKPSATAAQKKNASYTNPRYGFSITYPANIFTSSGSSSNGDGLVLYGDDISVSVYGSNNVFHRSLDESYEEMIASYPGASYHVKKSNFYVISGVNEDNNIYYIKEYVGTESINTVIMEYPNSKKKDFDAIVTTLANSFKPGNLSQAH